MGTHLHVNMCVHEAPPTFMRIHVCTRAHPFMRSVMNCTESLGQTRGGGSVLGCMAQGRVRRGWVEEKRGRKER